MSEGISSKNNKDQKWESQRYSHNVKHEEVECASDWVLNHPIHKVLKVVIQSLLEYHHKERDFHLYGSCNMPRIEISLTIRIIMKTIRGSLELPGSASIT